MFGTIWSLLPLLVAIILVIKTKEVYGSLIIGIILGALFATSFNPLAAFETAFNDGLISVLSDTKHIGIFLFIVFLGVLVELFNRSGATKAYRDWALSKIKTKRGALCSTLILSLLLSVDDYLHCLTVGSVMLPVNDACGVSRARFAYQIDATAAPLCVIIPISSWAATISTITDRSDGMSLFLKSIPYNFYSILTLLMILFLIFTGLEYGSMRKNELEANDLFMEKSSPIADNPKNNGECYGELKNINHNIRIERGTPHIIDLVLPIIFLPISLFVLLLYTGNFFRGCDVITALCNCNSSYSLAAGALITLFLTFIYYMLRGLIRYKTAINSISSGFIAMAPTLIVLILALCLKKMAGMIGSDEFIAALFSGHAAEFGFLLPLGIFIFSAVIAFSTGTSWGTFCILIPIVTNLASVVDERMLVIIISACIAGSVCGDHCSPISDTTIMASTGAKCALLQHVTTQIPYVLPVAVVSCVAYIVAGYTKSILSLGFAVILMLAVLMVIQRITNKKQRLHSA